MINPSIVCPKCAKDMTTWRPVVLLAGSSLVVRCPNCGWEIPVGAVSRPPPEDAANPKMWAGE